VNGLRGSGDGGWRTFGLVRTILSTESTFHAMEQSS